MRFLGWIKSSLPERHLFALDPLLSPNSSGGYRALCGVVVKKLEGPMTGTAAPDDLIGLPACEACEALKYRETDVL